MKKLFSYKYTCYLVVLTIGLLLNPGTASELLAGACSPNEGNNDCGSATSLTINAHPCTAGGTCGTVDGNTPSCFGSSGQDVWYSFSATATEMIVIVEGTTSNNCYGSAVWSGSCVPAVELSCRSNNGVTTNAHYLTGLTVSTTYYVQVMYQTGGSCGGEGSTCIKVSDADMVSQSDAACANNGTGTFNDWCRMNFDRCVNGTLNGAANNFSTGCTGSNYDVVFMVEPSSSSLEISVRNLGAGFTGNVEVQVREYPSYTTIIGSSCGAAPFTYSQAVTADQEYIIVISSSNNERAANTTFQLCVGDGAACTCWPPPGDAYAVHSPDALGGTVTTCELFATAGTGGTDGLVYANGTDVGTSTAISGYPIITAENINCLNADMDFTTTDPTPNWTDLDGTDNDATASMPDLTATINNNQYATSTGRKPIDFTGDVSYTATYTNTTDFTLVDNSCAYITSTITVPVQPSNFDGTDITITLDIGHTYLGDLGVYLKEPAAIGGQILSLASGGASGNKDSTRCTFFDGGALAHWGLSGTNAPVTGTFFPNGNLTNYCFAPDLADFAAFGTNIDVAGDWDLRVFDYVGGDVGLLKSWSITFGPKMVPTAVTYEDFVNMTMALPIAGTPTGNTPICSGVTGNYASPDAGTPGYVYSWTTSTSGTQVAPVIATPTASSTDITFSNVSGSDIVYTVYLDITSECCGPLAQVSKAVTVNSLPSPDPTVLDAAPSVCVGGSATLTVNSPNALYNYEWYLVSTGGSPVATGSSYTVTATSTATTYYIEAVTANGCRNTSRASVVLTGTDSPPTVPNPAAGCGPGIYTATVTSPVSGATYNWYSGAGPPPTGLLQSSLSTSYDINATSSPTDVYVTVTVSGCDETTTTNVTVTYGATTSVTWDGGASTTDWFTAINWNPDCVPDAGIDVIIPDVSALTTPDIQFANGGDANCNSITIDPSGALTLGDTKAVLNVYGNWTNNGTFAPTMGLVEFTGMAAQATAGSATTFFNLNVNKSSGTVTMGADLSVSSNLNLLDGILDINNNKITITNASTSAVGRVDGYLESEGQTSFLQWNTDATANTYEFPFGFSGSYIPFTFKKNAATATNIQVATWTTSVDNQTNIPSGTTLTVAQGTNNLVDRWWEISPSVVLSGDLTFRWTPTETSSPAIDYTSDPMSYHWNGSSWDEISGTAGTESITATWTSYSGGGGGGGPLPIDLWYFNAEYNEDTKNVDLDWATYSESNNEYFTVERSRDGKDFDIVVTVPGAGTSNQTLYYDAVDKDPYLGLSYYRLKQTDFDNTYEYSDLVAVNILENLNFAVWPNPAKNNLELTFGNATKGKVFVMTPKYNASIAIYDSDGRVVYTKDFNGTFYKFNIDISGFTNGLYIATLVANDKLYKAKFVKE